jgi:hypothetical protein
MYKYFESVIPSARVECDWSDPNGNMIDLFPFIQTSWLLFCEGQHAE